MHACAHALRTYRSERLIRRLLGRPPEALAPRIERGHEAHQRVKQQQVEQGGGLVVAEPLEGKAGAGHGHVAQVLDHVVLERAAAVVRLLPQEEDERQGVHVHPRVPVGWGAAPEARALAQTGTRHVGQQRPRVPEVDGGRAKAGTARAGRQGQRQAHSSGGARGGEVALL